MRSEGSSNNRLNNRLKKRPAVVTVFCDRITSMHEKELEILEHLRQNNGLHQRDLSRIVGLSLGMTNAILKRLAKKGFLMVRKVNNRNITYIVSPAGVEEISRRSYNYFKRTIKNIVYYKEYLQQTLQHLQERGIKRVVLEGESDVDFIIEHVCNKIGLQFRRADDGYHPEGDELVLVSENQDPATAEGLAVSLPKAGEGFPPARLAEAEPRKDDRRLYLRTLLVQR